MPDWPVLPEPCAAPFQVPALLLSSVPFPALLLAAGALVTYPKDKPASDYAPSAEGLDVPMGWGITYTGFLPAGRLRQEFTAAQQMAASRHADFQRFSDSMDPALLFRGVTNVSEPVYRVRVLWGEPPSPTEVENWWQPKDGCFNDRPEEFPVPLIMSSACEVDFLRVATIGGHRVVLAAAVRKEMHVAPIDGASEAIIAAASAAVHLKSLGLPVADCVVPFLLSNGQLEQHGAVYLLEACFPCAVLTTPVLDPSSAEGPAQIAAARWAMMAMADKTAELLKALPLSSGGGEGASASASGGGGQGGSDASAKAKAAAPPTPAIVLRTRPYFIKENVLDLVGNSMQHAIVHQLHVFARLAGTAAEKVTVAPVTVLMQAPDMDDDRYDDDSGAEEDILDWKEKNALVFPLMQGFQSCVPLPGEEGAEHRPAVLAALKAALQALHAAGVVHMDLYPANILWRIKEPGQKEGQKQEEKAGAADGAAAGGAAGAGSSGGSGKAAGPASVEVRLIDMDAALFIGQRIPSKAPRIVEKNGRTDSYHPKLFQKDELKRPGLAEPLYDWWHFALLERDDCPFAKIFSGYGEGEYYTLSSWCKEHKSEVLARVEELVARAEEAAVQLKAGSSSSSSADGQLAGSGPAAVKMREGEAMLVEEEEEKKEKKGD